MNSNSNSDFEVYFREEYTCMVFNDDSDVAQLEKLQQMLVVLNEKNFNETKDWILKSIFTKSDEGIHDLIFTFYLISSARASECKSSIFSRMIASLYKERGSNDFLISIPKQALEVIACAYNIDITVIANELIGLSIIDEPSYEKVISRERHCSSKLWKDPYISTLMHSIQYYPQYFSYENTKVLKINICKKYANSLTIGLFKAIHDDDPIKLQEIIANELDMNYDYNLFLNFKGINIKFTLIEFASFQGSIKCFKYLYLNKASISDLTANWAFYSGNTEIIHILEDRFDKELDLLTSANCFHNDIFDWLIETKGAKTKAIKSTENVHVLRKKLENNDKLGLHMYKTQSIILTKYLIDNCKIFKPNKYHRNERRYTMSFFNACLRGNVGLARFLYKECNCYGKLTCSDLSPFEIEVTRNHPEMVDFLRSVRGIDYFSNKDLIKFAVRYKMPEVLSLIIEINGMKIKGLRRAFDLSISYKDTNILKILLSQEYIRDLFDFKKYYERCIGYELYDSFRYLTDLYSFVDCSKVLASFCCQNVVYYTKILLEKVEKCNLTEFQKRLLIKNLKILENSRHGS